MTPDNYIQSEALFDGRVEELSCSFKVHKLHEGSTGKDCVRVYVDIEHDILYDDISYLPAMDLTYSVVEYERLMDKEALVGNLVHHYLQSEILSRDLDEYFH